MKGALEGRLGLEQCVAESTSLCGTDGSYPSFDDLNRLDRATCPNAEEVDDWIIPTRVHSEECDPGWTLLLSDLPIGDGVSEPEPAPPLQRDSEAQAAVEDPSVEYCHECEMCLPSATQLQDHLIGKKHKKNCKKPDEKPSGISGTVSAPICGQKDLSSDAISYTALVEQLRLAEVQVQVSQAREAKALRGGEARGTKLAEVRAKLAVRDDDAAAMRALNEELASGLAVALCEVASRREEVESLLNETKRSRAECERLRRRLRSRAMKKRTKPKLSGREQYEDHKESTKHRKKPEKEEDDDDKEYCPGNEGDDDDKEEKRGMKRRNTGEDSWKAGTPWDLKRPKKKARAGWRRWTLKRKYIMCQPDDRKRRPYLDDPTSTIMELLRPVEEEAEVQ